jgi:HAD superfamily hydrolase (TIGR01484 family)
MNACGPPTFKPLHQQLRHHLRHPVRHLVLDINGTLRRGEEKALSLPLVKALQTLQQDGVKLTFSSGSALTTLQDLLAPLVRPGHPVGASVIDGAQTFVYTSPTSVRLVHQQPFTKMAQIHALLKTLHKQNFLGTVFATLADDKGHTQVAAIKYPASPQYLVDRLTTLLNNPVNARQHLIRLYISGLSPEARKRTMAWLAAFQPDMAVKEKPHSLSITNALASKASSVAHLAKTFDIPLRETLAVGDGINDIKTAHLLQDQEGLMVAVGNAVPPLLQAAKVIAPPLQQSGAIQLFQALHHHLTTTFRQAS